MPVTLLDIIVISVMLLSGILAMVRGLMREVFSILSWVVAAGVTLYFYKQALPHVKVYITQDMAATATTIAVLFLGTLLIASIITARLSDAVLDSRIGALDRTLGFLFGLARGLLVMVVAFLFFNWLVPTKSQPPWVLEAKSRPALQSAGDWLIAQLPDDPENTILNKLKKPSAGDGGEAPASPAAPADPSSPATPSAPSGEPTAPSGAPAAPSGDRRTERGGATMAAERLAQASAAR